MHEWAMSWAWEERRAELAREVERWRLVRALREGHESRAEERYGDRHAELRGGIEVRWGLLEDEPKITNLLEINEMPRWIAFEERYIVADKDGEILAAVRYRTEKERLLLGLLVSDPWVEERPLAVALYAGAGELAWEMGVTEVIARPFPYLGDYPREAGYRRGRHEWRLDATRYGETRLGEPAAGRWKSLSELLGATAVPFVGLLRE